MNKYIKKPIPIEAEQFLLVLQECEPEQCFLDFKILKDDKGFYLTIPTPEGNHRADLGDWIVKGYSSKLGYHYWPVKPDYFSENYIDFGSTPKAEVMSVEEIDYMIQESQLLIKLPENTRLKLAQAIHQRLKEGKLNV